MGTGNNGGGAELKLDVERVKLALERASGIKSVAAVNLRVHRSTLYRFMDLHPELKEFAQEMDEQTLDIAEGKMITMIKNEDAQMIRFYLERKGRHRGYGQRQEVTGAGGAPLVPEAPTIDIGKLTFAERKQLLALHAKAQADDADAG